MLFTFAKKDSPPHCAEPFVCTSDFNEWVSELNGVRRDIENARMRFNMATEEELIDQCVYELNALQSRYTYFLRLIRESHGSAVTANVSGGSPCGSY